MRAVPELLRARLAEVPERPGCYLFKGSSGDVLYVGKARSLRPRVRSYFQESAQHTAKTEALVAEVVDLETIVTDNELEALILENSLIKREQPRYNIRLRDDKNHPYLKLTVNDEFPRLTLVRRARNDGQAYFGPYLPANVARRSLKMVMRFFGVATCYEKLDGSRPRPCLYYQLHQCLGPCAGLVEAGEYRRAVDDTRLFLDGKHGELRTRLEGYMYTAADEERFEAAAHFRDLLKTMDQLAEKQKIASVGLEDQDYFHAYREGGRATVQLFVVRDGVMQARREFSFEGVEETDAELYAATAVQYYGSDADVPGDVYLPVLPKDAELLESWLRERRRARVRFHVPQRGPKRKMLNLVGRNARLGFENRFRTRHTHGVEVLEALQEALDLPEPPFRIECFDISNIQGTDSVASMVVFEGGRPHRAGYRRYKIRTVEGADDFRSMAEVVQRRYRRLMGEGKRLPDLVLIDGGKGQLGAAVSAIRDLGLPGIPVASIAKREEEIFLEGASEPVRLPESSPVLQLLQRLRDEAHRFAVTYHRKLRAKRTLRSELTEIPGIGPATAAKLLAAFGSAESVRGASPERWEEVAGKAVAGRLAAHYTVESDS